MLRSSRHTGRILSLVMPLVVLGFGAQTRADEGYETSYDITTNIGQPVTNLLLLEEIPGVTGSTTWPFTLDAVGPTHLVNPFLHEEPITSTLMIGLVQDLPNDAPGQQHVVLVMDPQAAQLANHIAWGTLFRTTQEEDLIDAIELATSGQDFPIIDPGLDFLGNFANTEARDGILGPGGIPRSAWFENGGALTVMSWSDGTIIGDGTSTVTFVPEPTSAAAMLLIVCAVSRRRRA